MTVRSTSRGRPGAQTYLSRAVADAGSELGRYRSLSEVTIVGARVQPGADRGHVRPADQQAMEWRERVDRPLYPQQPHPFEADVGNIEPPFPVDISVVKDVSKV
jgi:hypothetical protein